MSNRFSFISEENEEYIMIQNNEKVISVEIGDEFIKIYKRFIPEPPKLPQKSRLTNNNLKIKTRYNNFAHYKKHLKNKRKRQRRKNNKRHNIN